MKPVLSALAGLAVLSAATPAAAQSVSPFNWDAPPSLGEGASNRRRPELAPLGLPAGAHRFYPSMKIAAEVDDNVFRSESGGRSDVAFVASPSLRLNSAYGRHELNLSVEADIYRYARESGEDREDFHFAGDGRLDIDRDTSLSLAAGLRRRHDSRSSPDAVAIAERVRFDSLEAELGLDRRLGPLAFRLEAGVERRDYADALTADNLQTINHDDRDRTRWRAGLDGAYALFEDAGPYFRLEILADRYRDDQDDGGFDRDAVGFAADIGARIGSGGNAAADVYVGFRSRSFANDGPASLNDDSLEAFAFGLRGALNLTPLTTLHARAERGVFTTALFDAPGGVRIDAAVAAEHELLRNLLLSAAFGGRHLAFEGIDRDDIGLLFSIGAVYMMNRHMRLEVAYEHESIRSDGAQSGVDSTTNRLVLSLSANP